MSRNSKVTILSPDEPLHQGDIFTNVKYNYIYDEDNSNVTIEELIFPMAVVVSQACDVLWMNGLLKDKRGTLTKYAPSILMCPIYDYATLKEGDHLTEVVEQYGYNISDSKIYSSRDNEVARKDWHYRLHLLGLETCNGKSILNNAAIDFKHCFSVPAKYLYDNRDNRICSLDNVYAQQVSTKFATYLSRIAIPD